MKNIRLFLSENFSLFLVVRVSIYLNRRVFLIFGYPVMQFLHADNKDSEKTAQFFFFFFFFFFVLF